jgi:putative ABC transport system permease protein
MGVGAMVSVLAMGDGVERFAREQLEQTTDLLAVNIVPRTSRSLDGLSVRVEDPVRFTGDDAAALGASLAGWEKLALYASGGALVSRDDDGTPHGPPRGFGVMGVARTHFADAGMSVVAGRPFSDDDTGVVVMNVRGAAAVSDDSTAAARALGRTVSLAGVPHRVVGIVDGGRQAAPLSAYLPIAAAERVIPAARTPTITIVARRVEDVDSLRRSAERWLAGRYGDAWGERVAVTTNRARVEQASTAMRVFKILMGAITGVSLLVGGIGIMNVLLAAVAERTREIGIRKAAGARDRDILVQFLAESVAITGAGAALGVVLGLGVAFLTAAIMRVQTNAPVHAAVTPGTILFAAGASVAVGLLFGLYPALRAARLSPIDAIRHE